jgi:Recombination endonuclease VII
VKRCKKCGDLKSTEDFSKNTGGRDDLRPECKACTAARRTAWYAENREREIQRVRQWQKANHEHYLAQQSEYRGPVAREHDTGPVRGLPCFSCNVGIGNFHQDVGHMMRAADYVDDDGSREELAQVARARAHGLARGASV